METPKENDVSPIVYAATKDEIIFCICAKAYYSSFSIVKNVLSSSVLVLLTGSSACAFCLVTIYALCFLEETGHCATRSHTDSKSNFEVTTTVILRGERPQHKSMCYSLKVPF